MTTPPMLQRADGMLTVSEPSRFIRHRGNVSWQRAFFAESGAAPQGLVALTAEAGLGVRLASPTHIVIRDRGSRF